MKKELCVKKFNVNYKKLIGENPIVIYVSAIYSSSDDINSGRTDIAKNLFSASIRLSKELFNKFFGSITYAYFNTKYKDKDVLFLTKRAIMKTDIP